MADKDLIVFGDGVLDYTYDLAEPVRSGGKMLGMWRGAVPGGTGANVACAASRFGLSVGVIGRVVSGEAAFHRGSFAQFGVDDSGLIEIAGERGSHTVIFRDPGGERTLAYVPLDAPNLDEGFIDAALASTRYAYAMAADLPRLGTALAKSDAIICLDLDAAAGLMAADLDRALAIADVLFINDIGFLALTGSAPDPERVAGLLRPGHNAILCCTGGAGTTFVAERKGDAIRTLAQNALPAAVIDTTGAGDCFNAGFVSELARGADLADALAFAIAAGSLATEVIGARKSIPERAAVTARAG